MRTTNLDLFSYDNFEWESCKIHYENMTCGLFNYVLEKIYGMKLLGYLPKLEKTSAVPILLIQMDQLIVKIVINIRKMIDFSIDYSFSFLSIKNLIIFKLKFK